MTQQDPLLKLSKDLKEAAATLSKREARFLVDSYYMMQENRKRSGNQVRSLSSSGEPHSVISWFGDNADTMERNIRTVLDKYSDANELGAWAKSITGIGPVIAAGLLAHIDIEKAPTVGHIWRFAGLDPTLKWDKGQKRPHNAGLKTLCWKIGESFVKVSGLESDVYGKVWLARKELETQRNEAGLFAEQAKLKLELFKIGKKTEAYRHYSEGRLPPAHIHSRAKRYAVKLFLSHYHWVGYEILFGCSPPKPYILAHGGHVHFIAPPNWPRK